MIDTDNYAWEITMYIYKDKILKLCSSHIAKNEVETFTRCSIFKNINIDFKKFMLWILKNKDGFITNNNVMLWIETHKIKENK